MNNKTILFLLGAAVIIVGVFVIVFMNIPSSAPINEESEENPEPESTVDIETIDLQFPETLNQTYISTVDWPPEVRVEEGVYGCLEAGVETARAGKTETRVINGHTYCVTVVSEGAAGSVYHMYAYNFAYNNQNVFITFSLRFPQCANYPEPEQLSCEEEQGSFDPDTLVDQVLTNDLPGYD